MPLPVHLATAADDYSTPAIKAAALVNGPLAPGAFAQLIRLIALCAGIVLTLFAWYEVADRHACEFHACLLLIIAGVAVTGAANDLIVLFLALELVSIPTYILLYLPKHDTASQEAAFKYFLLSVFSSALTLFGFSYLYGLAGTTNLGALFDTLRRGSSRDLPAIAHIAVLQPGNFDGGKNPQNLAATFTKTVKLKKTGVNFIDAAIAEVKTDLEADLRTIKGLGKLAGLSGCERNCGVS